ncbi:caveolae-associated protein 4-like [Hemitrygon akajei]|uniref:caveolae-associated protein 4-like n=1 Tax=Hemitrygon akajei TaxID=2704970 RepID=UPI003BF97D77
MAEERVHSDSSNLAFDLSASATGEGDVAPLDPLTIFNLLEKVAGIVDSVNETQRKMEIQQLEIENTVKEIQLDVAKLNKAHLTTDNTVAKLLEKTQKINANVKDVRQRLDKTNAQVKKVEGNHRELLKRNKFRVIIFQEENEMPSSTTYKKLPNEGGATATEEHTSTAATPPPDLSSDEEFVYHEETAAARFKKSGMKRVDDIKKVFSRENMQKTKQNLGKRMNRLSATIVPPDQREKIRISGERIKKSIVDSKPFHINIRKKNERSGAEGQEVAVKNVGESSKGEMTGKEATADVNAAAPPEVNGDGLASMGPHVANTETVVVTMEAKGEEVVPAVAEGKRSPEFS